MGTVRRIKGQEYELVRTAPIKLSFSKTFEAIGRGVEESDIAIRRSGSKWGLYIKKTAKEQSYKEFLETTRITEQQRKEMERLRRLGF
jgi:chromosome segregation and condensation protein ScpB